MWQVECAAGEMQQVECAVGHIAKDQQLVDQHLPLLSSDIVNYSLTGCSCHYEYLEKYAQQLVSTLLDCALRCFPCKISSSSHHLAGWNDNCRKQKDDANFWFTVWEEAGCPRSEALFNIKRYTKRKYKSSVRCLQHRQQYLLQEKVSKLYASKRMDSFWSKVKHPFFYFTRTCS